VFAMACARPPGAQLPEASPSPSNRGERQRGAARLPYGMQAMLILAALTGTAAADSYDAPISLSEIGAWPSKDAVKWVELTNNGESSIDLVGWRLVDRAGHRYVFPAGTPRIPPGAYVVVTFEGTRPSGRIPSPAKDGAVLLRCRDDWAVKMFSGEFDECAVLSPHGPDHIIDYVSWGRGYFIPVTSGVRRAAVDAGLWDAEAVVDIGSQPPPDGMVPLELGGSIGRMDMRKRRWAFRNWLILPPSDTTPGKPNVWPSAVPHFPHDGCIFSLEGPVDFVWRQECELTPRLQIAEAPGFENPLVDKLAPREPDRFVKLRPGTYYWRVGLLYEDGGIQWSRPARFTCRHGEPARYKPRAQPEDGAWSTPTETRAYTINTANCLVIPSVSTGAKGQVFMGKTFGPETDRGNEFHRIIDMNLTLVSTLTRVSIGSYSLHYGGGDVHCASNAVRALLRDDQGRIVDWWEAWPEE